MGRAKLLTCPDTLSVGARVSEMGEDRLVMQHRVVSHKLGAVAAEGEGTLVAYNYQDKRKAAIPDEVRRRIKELESHATQ